MNNFFLLNDSYVMYDDVDDTIQKEPLHSLDRFEKQKCPFFLFGGVALVGYSEYSMMTVLAVCRWSAMFSISKTSQMALCVLCILYLCSLRIKYPAAFVRG